eukprot:CAMPEP_0170171908 /NCGR_PEP_ID=MMETSP0040_2-20121228/5115_1 /TAXON_ID=641309 /ORGANISM="Lotharella oceanica, Strain CCMP622" /LENGTH=33 /DNA_ID= /DNA_START= /DNA_END= /DNA_ORIENTATION=
MARKKIDMSLRTELCPTEFEKLTVLGFLEGYHK